MTYIISYNFYIHRMTSWPIKNPVACMREMATKSLIGEKDVVLHTLMKWKEPASNIFQAAKFMIPHCIHPILRKARYIMCQLVYPFILPRRKTSKVLIGFTSLTALTLYLNTHGLFSLDIMLGWCLVHHYLNINMIRDILCSGQRVLC